MYINLSVLRNSGLFYGDLVFLCGISQIESDWVVENLTDDIYKRFEALSLIKHVKAKNKKEHLYTSLRLSNEGKQLMNELEEAPVEEQDEVIFLWLAEHFTNIGKEVGNRSRTKRHIRDFRLKSGVQKNNLIKICLDFIQNEETMQYSQRLEYVFYKPLTAFQTRFNLEDSRLYRHYTKHKKRLEQTFEEY